MRLGAFIVAVLSVPTLAHAERPFPFTWTSATEAKGAASPQLWLTIRSGRQTPYDALEARGWVGLGVARNVDVHLGLDADVALRRREEKQLDGRLSTQVRYRLLEPNDVVGLALLARAGVGVAATQLEARLILDRVLGDVLLAANSAFERTIFWDRRDAIETRLEHSFALRLAVTTDVTAGLELRARQAWRSAEYQGTGFYVGPTLSVRTKVAWVSIGAVAQVASHKAEGDRGNGEPIIFRDDERFVIRLVVGAPTPTK
ncbi:MAG: hypothetical protein SFW67_19400 [Myxococcaceae bacterium]|nr:hypothetical protein [Myxococcaceae bacterium]